MSIAPHTPIAKPPPRPKKPRKGILRFVRISQRSRKALARIKAWNKAKQAAFEQSGGRCVAQLPRICTGRAIDPHHKRKRSLGGKDESANCLPLCRACHDWIERNPVAAANLGLSDLRRVA